MDAVISGLAPEDCLALIQPQITSRANCPKLPLESSSSSALAWHPARNVSYSSTARNFPFNRIYLSSWLGLHWRSRLGSRALSQFVTVKSTCRLRGGAPIAGG